MKVNKTNLNKIIHWSPSKYCEYRKSNIIYKILNLKDGEEFIAHTGSYTENNSYGRSYLITRCKDKLRIADEKNILILEYEE